MDNGASSIDFVKLLHMIQTPYDGSLSKRMKRLPLVLNIPERAIATKALRWLDFEPMDHYVAFAKILCALASICHNPYLGSAQTDGSRSLYFNGNIPKVDPVYEALVTPEGTFCGYRLWIFINDPVFDFGLGLKKLVEKNREMGVSSGGNYGAARVTSARPVSHNCYRDVISVTDIITKMWAHYIGDINFQSHTIDDLHDPLHEIIKDTSPISPYNILTVQNAMELYTTGICKEQKDINRYFNTASGGVNISSFRGFPFKHLAYKIALISFSPEILSNAPLPHIIARDFNLKAKTIRSDLDKRQTELNEARQRRDALVDQNRNNGGDDDDAEEDFETEMLNEVVSELNALDINIQSKQQECDRLTRALLDIESYIKDTGTSTGQMMGSEHDSLEAIFATTNATIAQRIRNSEELKSIKKKYGHDPVEFRKHMEAFKKNKVQTFFHAVYYSNQVTNTFVSGRRWFLSLPPEKQWGESFQHVEGLSIWANFRIRLTCHMACVFGVLSNFRAATIIYLASLNAFYYNYGLHANVFLNGDPGYGKSFLILLMKLLLFPGAISYVTHLTEQAENIDGSGGKSSSDVVVGMEECPRSIFGLNDQGKPIPAGPNIKSQLAACFNKSRSFYRTNDGKRSVQEDYNRTMQVQLIANNDAALASGTPLHQRYIQLYMRNLDRVGVTAQDMFLKPQWAMNSEDKDGVSHFYGLVSWKVFLWEKAIEAKVFDIGICMDYANFIVGKFCEYLKGLNIKPPNVRQLDQFLQLCRSATLINGVVSEFYSELGLKKKTDENGNIRPFAPEDLLRLEMWGFCTEEIVCDLWILNEEQFVPHLKYEIATIIGKLANMKHVDGKWTLDAQETMFRSETRTQTTMEGVGAGAVQTSQQISVMNYHYIQLSSSSGSINTSRFSDQISRIKSQMKEDTSEVNIHQAIKDLTKEYVSSPVLELVLGNDGKTMTFRPKYENGHPVLQKIPAAIIDADPDPKARNARICIAHVLVGKYQPNLMRKCIESLANKYQPRRTYITGMPYQEVRAPKRRFARGDEDEPFEEDDDGQNELGGEEIIDTYHQVFDVVTIPYADKLMKISNMFMSDKFTDSVVNSSISSSDHSSQGQGVSTSDYNKHAVYKLDGDPEVLYARQYWRRCGLDPDKCMHSLPRFASSLAADIRKGHPALSKIQQNLVKDYPKEVVDEVKRSMDEIARYSRIGETEDDLRDVPGYSSLFQELDSSDLTDISDNSLDGCEEIRMTKRRRYLDQFMPEWSTIKTASSENNDNSNLMSNNDDDDDDDY